MRLLHRHPAAFDPATPWTQEAESTRQDSFLFRQIVAQRRSPHTGRSHAFYRLEGPDWVNVVAFTPEGDLVVVEPLARVAGPHATRGDPPRPGARGLSVAGPLGGLASPRSAPMALAIQRFQGMSMRLVWGDAPSGEAHGQ